MAIIQIDIDNIINSSLQVGDMAYVSEMLGDGRVGDPALVGEIIEINNSGLRVSGNQSNITDPNIPGNPQQFFSFAKNIQVNESSLKGYYADVTFKNASNKYAELFAISSDIVPSSK
jgi:hypothetical protein